MSLSLDLIFFYFLSKKVKKFKLSFLEKIFDIENDKMSFIIPENVFKHGKDKEVINIILYEDLNKYQNYKFNLYYGKNVAYIQIDVLSARTFEIIFQNMKKIKIIRGEKEFKELDDLGNQDRKRLTLINYENAIIEINKTEVNLYNIISQNTQENDIFFNQISILDLENNKENVYTFDLKNLNMIKSHLKGVFPKIILLCYIEDGEVALNESYFGGIIINEFYITKIKNIDYNSSTLTQITEEQKNDIAMNLFLDLIHEAPGHKKYALSEESNNSPKKIFNKNKKLITLRHKNDYDPNDNNSEYILTSYNNRGDSGHYLELCYGKYKNELVIDILRKMENKGKLIKYPELFTDDGKKLYEYVSLRKQIEENNIEFNFNPELSFEDDILLMKKELEKINNNKKVDNFEKENKQNNFLNKGKRIRDEKNIEDDNDGNDKNKKKKKKCEPNYLKSNSNTEKKENNQDEDETEKKLSDENAILDKEERLEIARIKIKQRFKLDLGPRLKYDLKKIIRELDPNDPDFKYVSLLLSNCYIKY